MATRRKKEYIHVLEFWENEKKGVIPIATFPLVVNSSIRNNLVFSILIDYGISFNIMFINIFILV